MNRPSGERATRGIFLISKQQGKRYFDGARGARKIGVTSQVAGKAGLGLAWSEQLGISIGNIPLRLHIGEPKLHESACHRYARFRRDALDALPVFLNDAGLGASSGGGVESRFSYVWEKSSLRLDAGNAQFGGVHHEYGLDSLIRVLLSVLLAPRQGFLLHAATVEREGRAYVFTGKSGAGKSTVASLSPAGSVLTDEISLLRFVDGGWHAFGTPFWGEFRAEGANVHAPVAGLYVLRQASENRVEKLSPRESLRAILPHILFFAQDRALTEKLLWLVAEFAAAVPACELFFRKDRGFWSALTT